MKKVILAAALLLSVGVTGAFACGGHHGGGGHHRYYRSASCSYCGGAGHNYCDANGDGACAYYHYCW